MRRYLQKHELGERIVCARTGSVTVVLSGRHMREIQNRGGRNSRAYMTKAKARLLGKRAAAARLKALTPEQRSESARRAARSRWAKRNKQREAA